MSVQNSIVIGEIFQIKVSDGLVRQLGSCQNITCIQLGFTGAQVFFRSLYAFRDPNDHYN